MFYKSFGLNFVIYIMETDIIINLVNPQRDYAVTVL